MAGMAHVRGTRSRPGKRLSRGRGIACLVVAAAVVLPSLVLASTADAATPTLQTDASPGVVFGGSVFDTAVLAGATNPTGTITFNLFAKDNNTCAGTPVFTSTVVVTGNGSYDSASYTPTSVGVHEWTASYSGDANNTPVITPCGD